MNQENFRTQKSIYFCRIITWYHFLSFCSYLESIEASKNKSNNTIVLSIGDFFSVSGDIPVKKLDKYAEQIELSGKTLGDAYKRIASERFDNVYLISNSLPMLAVARRIKKQCGDVCCVLIEEGIGTYSSFFNHLITYINEQQKQNGGSRVRHTIHYCIYRKLVPTARRILSPSFRIVKHYTFKADLTENKQVISSYKKALDHICENEPGLRLKDGKNLVFISSPLIKLGIIDDELFYQTVAKIINDYRCKHHIDHVYIKPHPIENWKGGLGEVITSKTAIEKLFWNNRNSSVEAITFDSTSAYTLPLFYSAKTYRISRLFDYPYKLSRRQKKILNRYSPLL